MTLKLTKERYKPLSLHKNKSNRVRIYKKEKENHTHREKPGFYFHDAIRSLL